MCRSRLGGLLHWSRRGGSLIRWRSVPKRNRGRRGQDLGCFSGPCLNNRVGRSSPPSPSAVSLLHTGWVLRAAETLWCKQPWTPAIPKSPGPVLSPDPGPGLGSCPPGSLVALVTQIHASAPLQGLEETFPNIEVMCESQGRAPYLWCS